MTDQEPLERRDIELPRWVQIPVGLVLSLITFLIGIASLGLLVYPIEKNPMIGFGVGILLLLGCLWVLEKCYRMVTGRRNQGGLMAPNTLRVLALVFLAIPIAAIFTGYYREIGGIALIQAGIYFMIFLRLLVLARNRALKSRAEDPTVTAISDSDGPTK
jgi:hypothetical protein